MSAQGDERRRKLLQLASAAVFLAIAGVVVLIVVNANKSSGGDASNLQDAGEVEPGAGGDPAERHAVRRP